MNNIDFTNIYSLSLQMFSIIKEEYNLYLNNEKRKFLEELNIFKFYKEVNDKTLPPIYYLGDTYYINSFYDMNNLINYIPFLCLASLCGSINPLKTGLIEIELDYLKEKYAIKYNTINIKEKEVAELVLKSLLTDVPYKIIFLENDLDILAYLQEEKGSRVGLFYSKISKEMKEKKINNYKKYNYYYEQLDYSKQLDSLFDFLSSKLR